MPAAAAIRCCSRVRLGQAEQEGADRSEGVDFLFFIVQPNIRAGAKAAAKPWDGAEGLEWTVPSPAPFHTFETPPPVK
jgi:hypothetical protein